MKFDAVIFDLDGTLIDTQYDIWLYLNKVLENHDCPLVEYENVSRIVGWGLQDAVYKALPEDLKNDEKIVAEYADELITAYADNPVVKSAFYPGIEDLLKKLDEKGIKMGVFSNKAHPVTSKIADILFKGNYFANVRGAVEGTPKKPAPDGAYHVAEALQVSRDKILYVGDSDVDHKTASNAGFYSVSVLWGYRSRQQLEEAGAVDFIEKPEELLKYFA